MRSGVEGYFAGKTEYHPCGSPDMPMTAEQTGRAPATRRMPRLSRGQATVEWVLIVSLIVVVIFGLIFFFRHQIFALGTEAWLKIMEWME